MTNGASDLQATTGYLQVIDGPAPKGLDWGDDAESLPAADGLLAHEDGSGFVPCYTADTVRKLLAAERGRCAGIVRNAAAHHGLCCSDCDALADLVAGLGA